jgi:hypothetical protein
MVVGFWVISDAPTLPKLGSSSVCRPLPMVFTNALELLVIMNVIASFWMGLMMRFALGFWATLLVCIVVSAPSYCENAVVMEKQVVRVMVMKCFMYWRDGLGGLSDGLFFEGDAPNLLQFTKFGLSWWRNDTDLTNVFWNFGLFSRYLL